MSKGRPKLKFSIGLVVMIALLAIVIGAVAGRASTDSSGGGGGGGKAAAAGKRVDVIIKASDSSFWQTMLAGAKKAGDDFGVQVDLFGPTSETDVNEQVQLVENSISRGVDAIAIASNSSDALNDVIDRAREAEIKVITVDNKVTTETDGFIGTDNPKAGEAGGQKLCELLKEQGKTSGEVLARVRGGRHPGAHRPRQGLREGPHRRVPERQGRPQAVQQQRHQHGGRPGQRRADLPLATCSACSPTTTPPATAPPAPSRTTTRPTSCRSWRSTPTRRRTRRWPTGRSTRWSCRTRTSSATRASSRRRWPRRATSRR